jgi:hypothetical protein
MHELDRTGAVLTFESVARHAGVSRSWIYTQTDLKDEIRRLRARYRPEPSTPPDNAPATTPYDSASKTRNEYQHKRQEPTAGPKR